MPQELSNWKATEFKQFVLYTRVNFCDLINQENEQKTKKNNININLIFDSIDC